MRLQKWYVALPDKVKKKMTREMMTIVLPRKNKMSNFIEWKEYKIIYKKSVVAVVVVFVVVVVVVVVAVVVMVAVVVCAGSALDI